MKDFSVIAVNRGARALCNINLNNICVPAELPEIFHRVSILKCEISSLLIDVSVI